MITRRTATASFLLCTLAACATGPRLAATRALKKTKATVRFEETPDRGTRIVLKAVNLAEPEALNPPGYSYVAWAQSDREAPPQNLGALVVDDDMKGVLKAVTPLRDFELFVTVEVASDAPRPTGPPLLWTHRDARVKLVRHDEWSELALSDPR